jgi:CHAT domain-containing protein
VTSDFPIRYFDLDDLIILNGPFVFLNACDGGTVGRRSTEGYARQLRQAGAHVVLATEAKIGDDFASHFSRLFYSAAKNRNVSEALLSCRRTVWEDDRNPSALFYGLYGDPRRSLGNDCFAGVRAS